MLWRVKMGRSSFAKAEPPTFLEVASAMCTRNLTDVVHLLRVACALSGPMYYKAVRSVRVCQCASVCRWAGPVLEKLKFNSFSAI